MLLTVEEFRRSIATDLNGLVAKLQDLTGRYGDQEAQAWKSSLPKVATAFGASSFNPLHLYFGARGRLALEYRLPSASSWCDMVLLGRHEKRPSAVIVELKDWQTRADRPGPVEGLMIRQGSSELHPSDQVRGYTEYCRRFHSMILDTDAAVHGCVIFTRDYLCDAYRMVPNNNLTANYPCFTLSPRDVQTTIPSFFAGRLSEPDDQFAKSFENGVYKQNRGFCRQIAEQLLDPQSSPFELLDTQRKAFSECLAAVRAAIENSAGITRRKVIIVDGPPGSGKSVVAAKVWASLVADPNLPEGNVVFATTSLSQNSNWEALLERAAGDIAARGVVIKANEYIPCTTHDIGRWRRETGNPSLFEDPSIWRENLAQIYALRKDGPRTNDMHYLISIVDEAHALINPEHADARGQFGFAVAAGPQAYHVIRGSVISVFFLDAAQSFRERETTTVEDLRTWAKELGAGEIIEVSLAGNQFRCGGSREYVDWVEMLLGGKEQSSAKALVPAWLKGGNSGGKNGSPTAKIEFRIFSSLFELEERLQERVADGATARLVASYARRWKTKGSRIPHKLPPEARDFYEETTRGGEKAFWSKVWNVIPNTDDYSVFIQAPEGHPMHEDPLCEVGCPYAVRGFDFDYVGVVWLGDLKWRDGGWTVDLNQVHESGLIGHLRRARASRSPDNVVVKALLEKVKQAYRILLTRAMEGVFLWFEDPETAAAVRSFLQ